MIEFRRMLGGGDAAHPVRDFKLNGAGDVVAAASNDTSVLGVYLGPNVKITADTTTTGKVRSAANAVYEMTVTGGTPVVGTGYPITLSSGDYILNAAVTTNALVKVVGALSNGNYEVVITGRQLV
jgi:hypothetical protein